LKEAILNDRDIIQSHALLIEKLKNGDTSQQKLALYALEAIQRYNEILTKKNEDDNYERQCLLQDREIRENCIELHSPISVKFDSHPQAHPAHKVLKELSTILNLDSSQSSCGAIQSTYKKSDQVMLDTFRMKAIRMIQTYLPKQLADGEVHQLVHQMPIYIDQENQHDLIQMRQKIETAPGASIILTGYFKKQSNESKFIMPMLDTLYLNAQSVHSGFPYPSQHTSWSLVDAVVEAHPLRPDQVPLFQTIDRRRKKVVQKLLFDQKTIELVRQQVKAVKKIIHSNVDKFLNTHRQLQEKLLELNPSPQNFSPLLETYYQEIKHSSSPFDQLVKNQQQFNDLFIKKPLQALEEEWFEMDSVLRQGKAQERLSVISDFIDQEVAKIYQQFNNSSPLSPYVIYQEKILGQALRKICLYYQSEKMDFAPPPLSAFEQRLQGCAFQQLIQFLNDVESEQLLLDPQQIDCRLQIKWEKDIQLLNASSITTIEPALAALIDELNVYFFSR